MHISSLDEPDKKRRNSNLDHEGTVFGSPQHMFSFIFRRDATDERRRGEDQRTIVTPKATNAACDYLSSNSALPSSVRTSDPRNES